MYRRIAIVTVIIISIVGACRDNDVPVPKPRIYPKVELPEQSYKKTEFPDCQISLQVPASSRIIKKEDQHEEHSLCFFDLYYPELDAALYCSVIEIQRPEDYSELISDSYKIADQINKRSEYMEESRIRNANGFGGILFEFKGPAASPVQFYLTDTTNIFFKGAVYFNTETNPDSLSPYVSFIQKDVNQLLESLDYIR